MPLVDKLGERVIIYAHGKRYKGILYSMDDEEIVLVEKRKRTVEYEHIQTDALTSYKGEIIVIEKPEVSMDFKFERQ